VLASLAQREERWFIFRQSRKMNHIPLPRASEASTRSQPPLRITTENKSIMFYYKVYNFTLSTPFSMSELMEIGPQSVDILIKEEPVPKDLDNVVNTGSFLSNTMHYQINETNVLLRIDRIGNFWIKNKTTVSIEREEGVSNEDIALYLLGTVFAYVVMLNGGFALHGSALKMGDGCVIFTGDSGVGKSTTAARLIEKGYPLLADDVCVISFDREGLAVVHPAYPQLKLWANSVEKLGYDSQDLKTVSQTWAKFRMPAQADYQNEPLKLNHVFELAPSDTDEINIEVLKGFNKVTLLLENTYRNFVIQSLNLEKTHFQFCTQLAQQIKIKRLQRPRYLFLLEAMIERIESEIQAP
jgi:HPr Serine kinase C-terminal domain